MSTTEIGVITRTCDAISMKAQMSLIWIKVLGVGNAFHLQKLRVTTLKPRAIKGRSWHPDFRMLKNTPIEGINKKL